MIELLKATLRVVIVLPVWLAGCEMPVVDSPDDGGDPDVVDQSPFDNTLATLRNDGGGGFELLTNGSGSDESRFMVVADMNGDGFDDVIAVNLFSATMSVMLNDGTGRLTRAVDYAVGDHPIHAVVADLDGDGDMDVTVTNSVGGSVSVLLNRSDGTFDDAVEYEAEAGATLAVVEDLNGDGSVEILISSPVTGAITVLTSGGGGAFAPAGTVDFGRFINSIVVAELDGDGELDVATANLLDGTVSVSLQTGLTRYDTGLWPHTLKTGDLNGDGALDLVVISALGDKVICLYNDGAGGFDDHLDHAVGAGPNGLVVADFNRDGLPDVAVSNGDDRSLSVLINQGNGNLKPAVRYALGGSPSSLIETDLDGDGTADLAVALADVDSVAVLYGDGDGGFAAAALFAAGESPQSLLAADLDGDGRDDLIMAGHATPTSPERPTGSTRVGRTSVPVPRFWRPEFVKESFAGSVGLDGILCLPQPMEWWPALPGGVEGSAVHKDQVWQKLLSGGSETEFFIQLDPYPMRRGTLSSQLPGALSGQSFASEGVRSAYKTEALARVEWYQPKYVCLAMEIDAYFDQQPDDFDNFFSLYVETREEIKALYPDTLVFVSFQYEQFLGRWGGLAGLPIHDAHWDLMERFEPFQDAVGISSYPIVSLIPQRFSDPELVPDDYYARIAEHSDLPVIFAELGWSPADEFGGSPETQAAFLRRFEELTEDLDLLLVNYFFLFDTIGFEPFFNELGLFDRRGQAREAFDVWASLWTDE